MKVTVSSVAAKARVRRSLRNKGLRLCQCSERNPNHPNLGSIYLVDIDKNTITATHVKISTLMDELQVLNPWETCELSEDTDV